MVERLRAGAVSFVLLLALGATWALATPMFAGPDEPSHLRKAAAAARGQLADELDADTGAAVVELPAVYRNDAGCFAFEGGVTADCMVVTDRGGDLAMGHVATGYPPTYHLLVGLPSLVSDGQASLYAQRLANAAAMAALLALAVTALAQQRAPRTAVVGLAAALAPIVAFLLGVVNPSGLAVAAGMATWAAGYQLARTAPLYRLGGVVARTVGPLCLLILLRRDSMLWGGLLAVGVASLIPRARWRPLVRSRAVWAGLAAVGVSLVVQLAVSGGSSAERFADNAGEATRPTITLGWALETLGRALQQQVGILGWQDTELPLAVHVAVGGLIAALVVAALVRAPRQPAVVAVGLVGVVAAAWLALDALRPLYIQGRYVLPLAVGVPTVAAMALAEGRRPLTGRWVVAALAVTTTAQVAAFWTNLRRYAVGADGPWWFFGDAAWEPTAAPAAVLVAANVAVALALAVHWSRLRPLLTR